MSECETIREPRFLPRLASRLVGRLTQEEEDDRELIVFVRAVEGEVQGEPLQLQGARKIVAYLNEFVAASTDETDSPLLSVSALRDGALGVTTYLVHLILGDVYDGRCYLPLRRLMSYLAAQLTIQHTRLPETLRPDDVFLVGLVEAARGQEDPDEIDEHEEVAREQLYRMVTTLQATASLPSAMNMRFRFMSPSCTVSARKGTQRLSKYRTRYDTITNGDPVPEQDLWDVGISLFGHHLFGLRRLLRRRARLGPPGAGDEPQLEVGPDGDVAKGLVQTLGGHLVRADQTLPTARPYDRVLLQLTELDLHAMRCFERVPARLPLYPLTVLVGGNGSGKSAVMDALALTVAGRIHAPPSTPDPSGLTWTGDMPALTADEANDRGVLRHIVGLRSLRSKERSQPLRLARVSGIAAESGDISARSGSAMPLPMDTLRFSGWFLPQRALLDATVREQRDQAGLLAALMGADMCHLRAQAAQAAQAQAGGAPPTEAAPRDIRDDIGKIVAELVGPNVTEEGARRDLLRAYDELHASVTAYEWRWDTFRAKADPRGRWGLTPANQPSTYIESSTQINSGNRTLQVVSSALLQFALAYVNSSRVLVIDDPFSGLDRYSARSLFSSLLRLRRYLEGLPRQRPAQSIVFWDHDAKLAQRRCSITPQRHPIPRLTGGAGGGGYPAVAGQLVLTCTDRDLALEAFESETFPMLVRIQRTLMDLLPDACTGGGLLKLIAASLGRAEKEKPVPWSELRWRLATKRAKTCAKGCSTTRGCNVKFHSDEDALRYSRRTSTALGKLGLHQAAAVCRERRRAASEKGGKPQPFARRLACALCGWLLDSDLIPALVGAQAKWDRACAGFFALPPPLRRSRLPTDGEPDSPQRLSSERGELALRLSTAQEARLVRVLRAV